WARFFPGSVWANDGEAAMNDALRLLARILRKYGYDIKEYYRYNLLPIANQAAFNETSLLHDAQSTRNEAADGNFGQFYICLRTCLRAGSANRRAPGFTGAGRDELVCRCMTSLIHSINFAVQNHVKPVPALLVLDDHSDREFAARLENICKRAACQWEIKTTRATGQGASLLEQFEFARDRDALFYFCEDDYLHEPAAILEMTRFYRQIHDICGTHLVIHPQEHEILYSKYIYPSYLLLGEHRHWRTISHATHTLFLHSATVRKFWEYFENTRHVGDRKKRRRGVESRTTNHLFKHLPGFAPIPALAAHMQTGKCLPPFFDWRGLWERNNPDQNKQK
ncbi:MAG: hypothetical protein ACRESK_10565, partial [Gammaproteobacteria bacterium]